MRSPQEIVMTIAYTVKEGKKGDVYTISDLSKRTQMHYMTMNDYLDLIEYVQENLPIINKSDQKGNAKIVIMEGLKIKLSENERMLLNMFDKGAFTKETAIIARPLEKENISAAIEKGLMNRVGKKYHLTTEGIIEAAKYAEKRADKVTQLKRHTIRDRELKIVDEWMIEDGQFDLPSEAGKTITYEKMPMQTVPMAA